MMIERIRSCPACGQASFSEQPLPCHRIGDVFFKSQGVVCGLKRCGSCGLEFVDPRPSETLLSAFYDQPGYPAHLEAKNKVIMDKARGRIKRLPRAKKGDRLLDIGCGNGAQLEECSREGWECVGMEPSVQGRAIAAARGFPVYGKLEDVGENERQFDIISLYHVLEHVADPGELFRMIRVLLKPGGKLIIEVPNLKSFRARVFPLLPAGMRQSDDRYRAFPIHLYGFSRRSIKMFLQRYQGRVVGDTTTGFGVEWYSSVPADVNRKDDGDTVVIAKHSKAYWRRLARWVWGIMEKAGFGENLTIYAEFDS
jgi:SAM-dependent methyltransferase